MSGRGAIVEIGTEAPLPPDGVAFALVIDFEKNTSNPQRVFQAAEAMIATMQGLDHTLCASVDSTIRPDMMLEDIEAGSIKVWLSNVLVRVDDEGLKAFDWKPIVGKYLVRAKYAVIRWSNKEGADASLAGLAREIRTIASETDIRYLPDYAPPSVTELADSVKKMDKAKSYLLPKDKISLSSAVEGDISFNLAVRWTDEELSSLAIKETTTFERMPIILIVKRPDYLGVSKWDFRLGKKAISAKIEDSSWLARFHAREIDIRPGDALRCLAKIENKYGFDNELIVEEYTVTEVEEVLVNQLKQTGMDL